MGLWEQFPYSNFHEMNLDWLIRIMKDHEDRIKALEKRIEEIKQEILDEVNAILKEFKEEILKELEERLIQFKQKMIEFFDNLLKEQLEPIKNDITNIFQQIEGLDNRLTDLEDKVEECCKKMQEAIDEINEKLDDIEDKITSIRNDITTIQGDITAIQGDITTIQGDMNTIQGDITTIQGNISTINSTIQSIQGDITTINNNITTIQNTLSTINTTLTNHQTDIDDLKNRVQALENGSGGGGGNGDGGYFYAVVNGRNPSANEYSDCTDAMIAAFNAKASTVALYISEMYADNTFNQKCNYTLQLNQPNNNIDANIWNLWIENVSVNISCLTGTTNLKLRGSGLTISRWRFNYLSLVYKKTSESAAPVEFKDCYFNLISAQHYMTNNSQDTDYYDLVSANKFYNCIFDRYTCLSLDDNKYQANGILFDCTIIDSSIIGRSTDAIIIFGGTILAMTTMCDIFYAYFTGSNDISGNNNSTRVRLHNVYGHVFAITWANGVSDVNISAIILDKNIGGTFTKL